MKTRSALVAVLSFAVVSLAQALEPPPEWAFPITPPTFKPPPDDGSIRWVPGSAVGYTLSQVRSLFIAPVWHATDHPQLPPIVARGRWPSVFACGVCHRADGPGGPENANIAGLPYEYIVQQMRDYRSGARGTSVAGRNIRNMISLAKDITDEEIEVSARYFAALRPKRVLRVVEAETIPKTYIVGMHYALVKGSTDTEPLGRRIVEVPDDNDRFTSRDSRMRFTAYVPIGSVQAGRELATTGGNGKTIACAACHGDDLKGANGVPGIAGQFASYTGRQLYDFKSGARKGLGAGPMKPVVEKLTNEDILLLSAYLASL